VAARAVAAANPTTIKSARIFFMNPPFKNRQEPLPGRGSN
jgi:hypothetical protein